MMSIQKWFKNLQNHIVTTRTIKKNFTNEKNTHDIINFILKPVS